ncbi:MAG: adenosine deaminase, alternative form [Ferruginibacter sp.]|nr:adenosine deaminase, alternative form [Ferruginibacter sp.]
MYRKFKPSRIFNGLHFLEKGQVLICTEEGSIEDIIPESEGGDGIEQLDGILSPGFINCHCHIELSHMRGRIPEHTGLVDFVQWVMKSRAATTEEKLPAMQAAIKELYDSGTVAVGDICNTADSLALKIDSPLRWHNFMEVTGFIDSAAEKRVNDAWQLAAHFQSTQPGQVSLSPHAPYSVSKTMFGLLNEQLAGKITSIHNQETRDEDALYQNKSGRFLELYDNFGIDISGFSPTGKSSFQSWFPYLDQPITVLSVHNSCSSPADIVFAKDEIDTRGQQLYFCLCPNANLFIENKLPPVEMLQASGFPLVIGTDSYASNRQLNMMEEINCIRHNFPQISLETILSWATRNGAKALGMDDQYGTIEPGKKPGIVLISPEMQAQRLI